MIPKSKMTIPLEGTPVVVWWIDAWSVAGADSSKEEFIERSKDPILRVDCGWLVHKDEDKILLALTLDPHPLGHETGYGGPSRIPRCLVRKIVPLCQSFPKRRSKSKSASPSRPTSASPSASPSSPSQPSSTSPPDDDGRIRLTAREFVEKYGPPDLGPGVIEPHDPSGKCGGFIELPSIFLPGGTPPAEDDMDPDDNFTGLLP